MYRYCPRKGLPGSESPSNPLVAVPGDQSEARVGYAISGIQELIAITEGK